MKRLKQIMLLFIIILFSGCLNEKEIPKIEKIDKMEYKETTKNYKYNIVIPQILNVQSEDISYFNLSLQENARLIIEELLEISEGAEDLSTSYEAKMNYEVKENDFGIISIVVKTSIYTGGAHGNTNLETYNIGKKDLKLINFESFFNENAKSYFEMKINDMIENKEKVYNINGDEVAFYEDVEINLDRAGIYFEGENINFIFPLYEIAPYSSGIPVFKFNKEEVKKYMK
ncbi:MAG: DUF4163 domain-containing protein [Fusobacterium sp.]|nr:DUF4163 domain-containing protein [Fusobacterium sp.]